jgi:hypothetical protein
MTTAVVGCGLTTSNASAALPLPSVPLPTLPGAPTAPTVPGVPGVVGTGTQCSSGLVAVSLGGQAVCAAPTVAAADGTSSCADGGVAVEVAGQGVICLVAGSSLGTVPGSNGTACDSSLVAVTLPGSGNLACVVPSDITIVPTGSTCTTGLIPVSVLGGGLGCVVAGIIGGDGANGTNGANGAGGSSGGSGSGGSGSSAGGTGANGANGINRSGSSTGAAGSSSTAAGARVYKPTLTLAKKVRRTARGTIRSSTKKVVLTIIGRRNGRTVRYTKQISLPKTGKTGTARPYSAKVRLTIKTKGKIRLRLTSRGSGSVKTANYTRTVIR